MKDPLTLVLVLSSTHIAALPSGFHGSPLPYASCATGQALLWSAPLSDVAYASAIPMDPRGSYAGYSDPLDSTSSFSAPLPIFLAALFDPSASASPMCTLLAIIAGILTKACSSPNFRFRPPVSFLVSIFLSYRSIANAVTLPADIVSNPSLSHSSANLTIASMFLIPQLEPDNPIVSYSGPSVDAPLNPPLLTFDQLPHAIPQPMHAFLLTRTLVLSASELI